MLENIIHVLNNYTMAIYGDGKHNENMEHRLPTSDEKKIVDPINAQDLINFLEYEEALTKDKDTASRIRTLLTNLGIWS
jgi:hypothetical protein